MLSMGLSVLGFNTFSQGSSEEYILFFCPNVWENCQGAVDLVIVNCTL